MFDATSVRCRTVTETTICRIFLILPLSRDEDPTGSGGILDALRCHGAAAFRAAATNFGAARHLRVVHGVACIGALAADLRAGTANHVVNAGTAQHRVGTGCAGIGTRRQQGDVLRGRVNTSFGQAVVDGLQADRMALRAVVDALVQAWGRCAAEW